MEDIIFEGSAKLEKDDFMEGEKLTAKGGALGTVISLMTVFITAAGVLGLIFLLLFPIMQDPETDPRFAVRFVVISAVYLIASRPLSGHAGRTRANAPINQNRTAHICLYGDRLIYKDEFVRLTALYTDTLKVLKGKRVFVFIFDGADNMIVPIRSFGWENCKNAEAFLREKLGGRMKN